MKNGDWTSTCFSTLLGFFPEPLLRPKSSSCRAISARSSRKELALTAVDFFLDAMMLFCWLVQSAARSERDEVKSKGRAPGRLRLVSLLIPTLARPMDSSIYMIIQLKQSLPYTQKSRVMYWSRRQGSMVVARYYAHMLWRDGCDHQM
jgi:hypothetical protein